MDGEPRGGMGGEGDAAGGDPDYPDMSDELRALEAAVSSDPAEAPATGTEAGSPAGEPQADGPDVSSSKEADLARVREIAKSPWRLARMVILMSL